MCWTCSRLHEITVHIFESVAKSLLGLPCCWVRSNYTLLSLSLRTLFSVTLCISPPPSWLLLPEVDLSLESRKILRKEELCRPERRKTTRTHETLERRDCACRAPGLVRSRNHASQLWGQQFMATVFDLHQILSAMVWGWSKYKLKWFWSPNAKGVY